MNILSKKPWRNLSYKSRRNRELGQPRQTVILDMDDQKSKRVVRTQAGDVLFDQGMAFLPDDSRGDDIASEIVERERRHPDQFAVVKHREGQRPDGIHRYTFGQWPGLGNKNSGHWKEVRPAVWKLDKEG